MNKRKVIGRFIILKLAELAAIVFVPWGVGWATSKWVWLCTVLRFYDDAFWLHGVIVLICFWTIVMIPILTYSYIILNWEWARKWAEKS